MSDDEVQRFRRRLERMTHEAHDLAKETEFLAGLFMVAPAPGTDARIRFVGRRLFGNLADVAEELVRQLQALEPVDPAVIEYIATAMSQPGDNRGRAMAGRQVIASEPEIILAALDITADEVEASASGDDWDPTKGTTSATDG